MADELLSSKVVVDEPEPQARPVVGVSTDIAGILGITERGPVGVPTLITSPAHYRRIFGGYVRGSFTPQAIDGFFDNGGSRIYVSRVVHYVDPADPATKASAVASATLQSRPSVPSPAEAVGTKAAPWDVPAGGTLVIVTDGGPPATATFQAGPATIQGTVSGPFDFSALPALEVRVNGTAPQIVTPQSSEFANPAAATEAEVAAVLNARLRGLAVTAAGNKVALATDRRGTAATIEIVASAMASVLGLPTGTVGGTGNVSDSSVVTEAEFINIVTSAAAAATPAVSVLGTPSIASKTTGNSSQIQVTAGSTAAQAFGFTNAIQVGGATSSFPTLTVRGKTDGAYANGIVPIIIDATSRNPAAFNVLIERDGVVVESYADRTMDPNSPAFVEQINQQSTLIQVTANTPPSGATTALLRRPANGHGAPLAGGNDGLTNLDDRDFIGATGPAGRTGFRAFDTVEDLSSMMCPDQPTAATQNALLTYCEIVRKRMVFAILDSPAMLNAIDVVDYVTRVAQLRGLSEAGAMFWPRVLIDNPRRAVFGDDAMIVQPPCGHIAGMIARNDRSEGGVYQAPAGEVEGRLYGVRGFETNDVLDEAMRDIVYPALINPIRSDTGVPPYVDGHKTLREDGNFPGINERRGVSYIERSCKRAVSRLRHRNNDDSTQNETHRLIERFLEDEMRKGAFRSRDPKTAFFIDVKGQNTVDDQFRGKLHVLVGLATPKAIDFIVLRFTQDVRALLAA